MGLYGGADCNDGIYALLCDEADAFSLFLLWTKAMISMGEIDGISW